jgi:hypothetical protein
LVMYASIGPEPAQRFKPVGTSLAWSTASATVVWGEGLGVGVGTGCGAAVWHAAMTTLRTRMARNRPTKRAV